MTRLGAALAGGAIMAAIGAGVAAAAAVELAQLAGGLARDAVTAAHFHARQLRRPGSSTWAGGPW